MKNSKQGKTWSHFPITKSVLEAYRGWAVRHLFNSLSWLDRSQTHGGERREKAAERLRRQQAEVVTGWRGQRESGQLAFPQMSGLRKQVLFTKKEQEYESRSKGGKCSYFKKDQGHYSYSVVGD